MTILEHEGWRRSGGPTIKEMDAEIVDLDRREGNRT
jgi:hypothetical protein